MFVGLHFCLQTVGGETNRHFVMQCQQSCPDCKNEGLRDRRGGAKTSCNVKRMRKACYFHPNPSVSAVSSHFPKRHTH